MAQSFIGKPISLISHSDVRYRGILAGIDPAASTIQLSNVYSMGTEHRRPPTEFIPPVPDPYQYIIFRASEVKDLAVDEPASSRRSVHDDPAVLAVPPGPNHTSPYPAPPVVAAHMPPPQQQLYARPDGVVPHQQQPQQVQQPQPQQVQQPPPVLPQQPQVQQPQRPPQTQVQQGHVPRRTNQGTNSHSVHTAAASLETVERALGDLRVSNAMAAGTASATGGVGRGGRRSGGSGRTSNGGGGQLKVPTTDFDFESSNAKFDKAALKSAASPSSEENEREDKVDGQDGESETKENGASTEGKESSAAYNPKTSFFDSLSSALTPPPASSSGASGNGRRGLRGRGGGGMGGRNRREEEREKNVATFGEPGGVGLMGPGAYVGGWGGYGRRGGRARRGQGGGQGLSARG